MLVAYFFLVLFITLRIGDVTEGHGIIGIKGFTGVYTTNPFKARAKVVRCVLNTGSIGVRIAEGPLCWLSVIALLHFTATYQERRAFPCAATVRPRGLQIRQGVMYLRKLPLRRRHLIARLLGIAVRASRMNIAARGGDCAANRILEARGLRRLAT